MRAGKFYSIQVAVPADFVPLRAATPTALAGARWAWALCAALLLGFGLLTGARWFGPDGAHPHETVVQQPVVPNDFSPVHPEATAPDPGDTP